MNWLSINDNDSESQTRQKVHLPTGQQPWAHSQDNKRVAKGQLCECPRVAQPEPRLEHDWTTLERSENRCSPSNLMELERSCKGEWEKPSKNRCAKLVASYSKRLEAVIVARGASTKYWAKAVNTYVHVIFIFYKFAKTSNKLLSRCHYGVLFVEFT